MTGFVCWAASVAELEIDPEIEEIRSALHNATMEAADIVDWALEKLQDMSAKLRAESRFQGVEIMTMLHLALQNHQRPSC